jgi:hypothetical protein
MFQNEELRMWKDEIMTQFMANCQQFLQGNHKNFSHPGFGLRLETPKSRIRNRMIVIFGSNNNKKLN